MQASDWWIDHAAHTLHHRDCSFPCRRDIEAMAVWRGHALLLSSDTDCLSLWDAEGLVRLTRVGVYPQDMAIWGDSAVVCGGADCRLHLLTLPELVDCSEIPLPGMPERICIVDDAAYSLTLMTEPDIHTLLLTLPLSTLQWRQLERFAGIPERICVVDGKLKVEVL